MIREATLKDTVPLLMLLEQFYDEGKIEKILKQPWDEKAMYVLVRYAIESPDWYVSVFEEKDRLEGVMMCDKGYFLNIPTFPICEEMVWYIRPEKRKRLKPAKDMLKGFEEWAKKSGAVAIAMGTARTLSGDKTEAIVSRQGYYKGITLHYKHIQENGDGQKG